MIRLPAHELDHLVVAARTLEQGVAWSEAVIGVRPDGGGQHRFMGTHNRVFDISSVDRPRAYLEIIAIDPSLPAPRRRRWFDLDDPALQAQLADSPRLVHWVARVADIDAASAELRAQAVDVGRVIDAERGALRWRISVRDDGRRALDGAVPALIQWSGAHPTDGLRQCGVRLAALSAPGDPLAAVLEGPRGRVSLTAAVVSPSSSS